MRKDLIKKLLREVFMPEASATKQKPGKKSDTSKDVGPTSKKKKKKKVDTYPDVRRAMNKKLNPTAPSQVGVMKAIGISDDKKGINRGLFNKKLRRVKNQDTGSIYKFDENELTGVRRALDIA
tara:strand:+ start:332 stop:700 length:369 start_codon:yes stop_codon:yes gene_type:complete